jgi:hypothetical protein
VETAIVETAIVEIVIAENVWNLLIVVDYSVPHVTWILGRVIVLNHVIVASHAIVVG